MTSPALAPARAARRREPLLTPEGVVLEFEIASVGDRLAAFLFDTILVVFLPFVVLTLLALAEVVFFRGWGGAFVVLLLFVLVNFGYFILEVRGRGASPGKRRGGLRVIDRRGGALGAEALFVRNVMRMLEFWLPLSALLAPEAIAEGGPTWARLTALAWFVVLMLLPCMNRQRLRAGDLVAGTLVVRTPTAQLLSDVGRRATSSPSYAFTPEQLSFYGIYELQVLEGVLRQRGAEGQDALLAVAQRIAKKIGWRQPLRRPQAKAFLEAFYAAQRAHLERGLLFGKRKQDKHGGSADPG